MISNPDANLKERKWSQGWKLLIQKFLLVGKIYKISLSYWLKTDATEAWKPEPQSCFIIIHDHGSKNPES